MIPGFDSYKKIRIGEHHLSIPQPRRKDDILYVNERPDNAFWRRIEYPDYFYQFQPFKSRQEPGTRIYADKDKYDADGKLVALSEEKSSRLRKYLEQDLTYRLCGLHFKNKDKIIWLAPDYYFTLQWGAMKDLNEQYGNYRHPQNDIMILWEHTKRIDWAAGLMIPKAKKTGLTQIFAGGAFVNESTLYSNMEFGAASKEFDHVKAVAMAYYFYAFDQLPAILKPEMAGRNLTEVKFGQRVVRGATTAEVRAILNNRVNGYKTKVNAFDGPVLKRGLIDELPKWWESSNISPDLVLKTNIEGVKLNQKINGKLIIFSYMPEVDDRGFREFKKWYYNSKLSTRGENGRTTSQLICHPLTAIDSNESCFDRWGYCDQQKAWDIVSADYNSKTTVSDRLAHRRQYMKNENDAFDAGGKGTVFDNIRIGEQYREVEQQLNTGKQLWKYAQVHWDNPLWESGAKGLRPQGQFTTVSLSFAEGEELENGACDNYPIHLYQELPADLLNRVLQVPVYDEHGTIKSYKENRNDDPDEPALLPIHHKKMTPFIQSLDPVDYVVKADVRDGSSNASHGGFIFDPVLNTRGIRTNTPVFEYYFRHDDPDTDLENIIKLIILFGARIIVEANKKWVVTALKKEKLHHFLLLKQKDGSIKPYKEGDENNLVNATAEMINVYTLAIKRWLSRPRNENADLDFMKLYVSINGLEQLLNFEPTDTKRYDIVVSLGWWRLAVESFIAWMMSEEAEDEGDEDTAEGMKALAALMS
jgi:hypothetical protein